MKESLYYLSRCRCCCCCCLMYLFCINESHLDFCFYFIYLFIFGFPSCTSLSCEDLTESVGFVAQTKTREHCFVCLFFQGSYQCSLKWMFITWQMIHCFCYLIVMWPCFFVNKAKIQWRCGVTGELRWICQLWHPLTKTVFNSSLLFALQDTTEIVCDRHTDLELPAVDENYDGRCQKFYAK